MTLICARDLTIRWTRGIAVGPLSFEAQDRLPVAVVGPSGSGKSTLLLALVGRMRGVGGQLEVAGCDGIRDTKTLIRRTTVARIGGYVDIENNLSIEDCLTERALLDAAKPADRHTRFFQAAEALGMKNQAGDFPVSMDTAVGDLSPLLRTQLCVALTAVRRAALVVIDDVDRDLSLIEQEALWRGFAQLSVNGPVVVASTREALALPEMVTEISLGELNPKDFEARIVQPEHLTHPAVSDLLSDGNTTHIHPQHAMEDPNA